MIRRCPVILLVIAVILSGCSHKAPIPPRKMAMILHDMYVVDAQIEDGYEYVSMADTSSVYGAVFAQYGYDLDDFNSSLDYYLHNPIEFKEIFKMAHDRFEKEVKDLMVEEDMEVMEEMPVPDEPAERKAPRGRRNRQVVPTPDEIELE